VHGDGGAVRSYLFVEDVAAAFDTVLHKGLLGEVYNIGTQVERSVVSVAADICRHFNLPQGKIVNVRDRAFNDRWGVGGGGGGGCACVGARAGRRGQGCMARAGQGLPGTPARPQQQVALAGPVCVVLRCAGVWNVYLVGPTLGCLVFVERWLPVASWVAPSHADLVLRAPPPPPPPPPRRYYICDKKLLTLGWKEAVTWEDGLRRTIEWYSSVGSSPAYWENGDMECALEAHPTLQPGLMRSTAAPANGRLLTKVKV
jgi:hypothetical protein